MSFFHPMKLMHSVCVGLAFCLALPFPAEAQRAVSSPLMVTVVRTKSSGRTQQISLKTTVRNMSKKDVEVRLEALFIAAGGSRSGQDGIYFESKATETVKAGESHEFETESDQPSGSSYNYNGVYYYYSTMKVRGYLTRVFADGQLVNVTGSTPSFQKAGWDDKELAKLGYSGAGAPAGRPEQPATREEPMQVANVPGGPRTAVPSTVSVRSSDLAARILQSGLRKDLAVYYALDERPGEGSVRAASNPDHVGTMLGNVSAQPCIGSALRFERNAAVNLGKPGELNFSGPITLSAWVRTEGPSEAYRSVLYRGSETASRGDMYIRIRDGKYQIGAWDGQTDHFAEIPVPAADAGTWVHLAGSFDGTAWRLYRNGVQVAEKAARRGAILLDGDWILGAISDSGSRSFGGAIDELAIWKRALSPDELLALHDAGKSRMAEIARRPTRSETDIAPGTAVPLAPLSPVRIEPPPAPVAPTYDAKIYEQYAKLYNESMEAYQAYLKNRTGHAGLRKIETDLRTCSDELAKIVHGAPESLDLPGLIARCNQTIFAIHATLQVQP